MKQYNKRILNIYEKDLKVSKNNIPTKYFVMANNIAKKQDKSYGRVGVMDLNDLIQESNVALIKGWGNINWKYIKSVPNKERDSAIHGYLYKTINLELKQNIHNKRDGVRTPHQGIMVNGVRSNDSLNIVTALFPNWFGKQDEFMKENLYFIDDYANEQLSLFLEDFIMRHFKTVDYQIITWFYGIDCERKSYKEIAEILNSNHTAVQVRKKRVVDSLKSDHMKDLISVFIYDNEIKTHSDVYQWIKKRNLRK